MGHEVTGEFAEVEGYHPPQGYFLQTPTCDAAMRLWLTKCAFVDVPNSIFWETSQLAFFPPKDTADTSASFIGNLLANQAAEMYLGENSNVKQAERMNAGGDGFAGAEKIITEANPEG